MTVPAVAAARRRPPPPDDPGVDRWAGLVEFYLRFHTIVVYAFLYLPIVVWSCSRSTAPTES